MGQSSSHESTGPIRHREVFCTELSNSEMQFVNDSLESDISSSLKRNPYELRRSIYIRNEPIKGCGLFIIVQKEYTSFYIPFLYFAQFVSTFKKQAFTVQIIETKHVPFGSSYTKFGFCKINFVQQPE